MVKKRIARINSWYWKNEIIGRSAVTVFGFLLIAITLCLVVFIASKGLMLFLQDHKSLSEFLFSTKWQPDRDASAGGPAIGALIFIAGSVTLSMLALLLSFPFCLSTSIFISEISPNLGKKLLQPAIEIFVGIPSVVYGWIGLSVLVPFVRLLFGGLGFSLLAGAIVLAVMIFPTITSIAVDAFRSLPEDFKEASYALAAMPGILTGVVLGLARAFGEALAVQMVIGNTIHMPDSLLKPMVNLTSIITLDMANTAMGSTWNNALWSMALLLLIISFVFILLVHAIGSGRKNKC
jgi:phosphate transport system permease protein